MADRRRSRCRCCYRPRSECGEISWEGNCLDCAKQLQAENIEGIANKRGYAYRRQLKATIAKAQRELDRLDALHPNLAR